MKSIIYKVTKPAKTFHTNTYLFLGFILTGIGVYYFITQLNWRRPEEFIPLGVILTAGLYLLLGYQGKWALPNSKNVCSKIEYFINSETNELACISTYNQNPPKNFALCSLKGVESFDYEVESKTTTSRFRTIEDIHGYGLGHTAPSGLNYRYRIITTNSHTNYLILLPAKEKVIVSSNIANMSYFADELKKLLLLTKQNSPTSPQSL